MTVLAAMGPLALYLLLVWLASAVAASWLSERKGYGEQPGLAAGLLLSFLGVVAWCFVPGREGSRWGRGLLPDRHARDDRRGAA